LLKKRRTIGILATFRALTVFLPLIAFQSTATADEGTGGNSNHTVSASYEFYGRAPYPGFSRGARVGYIFSNRQELGLSYVTAEQDLLLTSYQYNEYALMLSFWTSHYIYFGLGGGYRTVTINSQVFTQPAAENEATATHQVHEQYKMLTANSALGIEIPIFANLVIGAEIFGVSTPIHWFKKTSNFPDNAAEYEEDPKSYPYIRDGLKTNYHLIRSFVKVRL